MDGPDTPTRILRHALSQPTALGPGRLVAIDGPAGSGKTSLAEQVATAARENDPASEARVLHMDDLYQGWSGLTDVATNVAADLLAPLADGRPGRYRRWDWHADAWAEEHEVVPVALLVLEGVGSGARDHAAYLSTLVWVEAPWEIRLARGLARDGEAMRHEWERWRQSEADHFMVHDTRARADLHVDGTEAGQTSHEGG